MKNSILNTEQITKKRRLRFLWFWFPALLLSVLIPAFIQAKTETPADAAVSKETISALERAVASNRAALSELQFQASGMSNFRNAVLKEIQFHESNNFAHRQLLLVSDLRIEELEDAIDLNRRASVTLSERVEAFRKRADTVSVLLHQTDARIELADNQKIQIHQSTIPENQRRHEENDIRTLMKILVEKRDLMERRLEVYQTLLVQLETVLKENKTLGKIIRIRVKSTLDPYPYRPAYPRPRPIRR